MLDEKVSKIRWLIGLEKEKEYNRKREELEDRISERRQVWANLLDLLKDEKAFDNSKRILDIGSEATSIFLALKEGKKYAVDPLFEYLFDLHPFLREIEDYKDVKFISSPIEDMVADKSFDIIFILAALEHVGKLKQVVDKIDELLTPSGTLIIFLECYIDPAARNIMSFFDIYPYHPHHFVAEDIIRLFSIYKLKKEEQVREIYHDIPSRGLRKGAKTYRIDKLIAGIWQLIGGWGSRKNILFVSKLFLCYGLVFLVAFIRVLLGKREGPIYPLKRPWLFVFQKQ